MRPLVIDDNARAKAAAVVAYAEKHHYVPGTSPPPGDVEHFVALFDTYRTVFSFTEADGLLFRHLTISVPSANYPNPAAAFTIAALFGFAGWDERTIDRAPDGWMMSVHEAEHCVVVVQPIGALQAKEKMQ